MILFLLTAVILTLLVLIQRGRGGGLAGAFGGAGGSSAFGTKTADVFVRATAIVGALFFILSIITAILMRPGREKPREAPAAPAPAEPGAGTTAPAEKSPAGGAAAPAEKPATPPPSTAPAPAETPKEPATK
jgi:preprotein translocase subunit SecG